MNENTRSKGKHFTLDDDGQLWRAREIFRSLEIFFDFPRFSFFLLLLLSIRVSSDQFRTERTSHRSVYGNRIPLELSQPIQHPFRSDTILIGPYEIASSSHNSVTRSRAHGRSASLDPRPHKSNYSRRGFIYAIGAILRAPTFEQRWLWLTSVRSDLRDGRPHVTR